MSKRPNILLVTTDQQRADCLGISDSRHPVMTPHLDQLASEGVRFTRAYSDCPLCIPSRTTIMTGKAAYTHGVATNGEYLIPEAPELTLPGRLRHAGYQTHAAGKMHFIPPRNRNGFERMRLVPEDYVNFLETTDYRGLYRGHGLGGNEVYPTFSAVPTRYSATHWTVNESIEFLRQRDTETPFFMWTSFEAPHPPYDPPESYVRLYDGVDIPQPAMAEWAEEEQLPTWVRYRRRSHKLDHLPQHVIALARKHYYAQITHIDYELGRLFGEMKSQGIWNDTLVIFTSDHGEMLGDHGLFHKTCFYESSANVPFLLKPPLGAEGSLTPSTVISTPIALADIYPTALHYADLLDPSDGARDGRSLLDLHNLERERPWLYGFMNEWDGLYMITNGEWKYVYYVLGGNEQLFYLPDDPAECRSMLETPEGRLQLPLMRRLLAERFPNLLASGCGEAAAFIRVEAEVPAEQLTVSNPFAWRGPIRYGGHW
ncbi:sulfatase-like hydrolase/transferase [Paenibacillus oryzisoli]|uniref:sulfatase-like hydrolase/transferase n=1 Tax=Paenibacillus oryzisoli TaxID=1850517 RepID=UPI003D2DF2D2